MKTITAREASRSLPRVAEMAAGLGGAPVLIEKGRPARPFLVCLSFESAVRRGIVCEHGEEPARCRRCRERSAATWWECPRCGWAWTEDATPEELRTIAADCGEGCSAEAAALAFEEPESAFLRPSPVCLSCGGTKVPCPECYDGEAPTLARAFGADRQGPDRGQESLQSLHEEIPEGAPPQGRRGPEPEAAAAAKGMDAEEGAAMNGSPGAAVSPEAELERTHEGP